MSIQAQIERVLQSHEAVALAAVIGMPHPKWGESGWAFCKLHDDCKTSETELLDWCKQQLAKFECPERVVMLHEIPLGQSAKVDKLALRDQAEEMRSNS